MPTTIQNLAPAEERARLVLRRLMAIRETSGAELARRTGYTPQTVSDKVKGSNRVRLSDLTVLAPALGVEEYVFLLDPDDAVRWALDNAPAHNYAEVSASSGWNGLHPRRHRPRRHARATTYCFRSQASLRPSCVV